MINVTLLKKKEFGSHRRVDCVFLVNNICTLNNIKPPWDNDDMSKNVRYGVNWRPYLFGYLKKICNINE